MRKPRSQHARLLNDLNQSRFEIWWSKRRLREIAEDRARAPYKFDWDIIESSYQESLALARRWHAEVIARARAIRLATQLDPLYLGTLHLSARHPIADLLELFNPPDPSRAAAATRPPT